MTAPITISLKGQAVTSFGDEGVIWVFEDITEQRAQERALQTYRAVFESSRDATGQVEGVLSAGVDVTESRQMEAELEYQSNHAIILTTTKLDSRGQRF